MKLSSDIYIDISYIYEIPCCYYTLNSCYSTYLKSIFHTFIWHGNLWYILLSIPIVFFLKLYSNYLFICRYLFKDPFCCGTRFWVHNPCPYKIYILWRYCEVHYYEGMLHKYVSRQKIMNWLMLWWKLTTDKKQKRWKELIF